MEPSHVLTLHGFLGLPEDWSNIKRHLAAVTEIHWHDINLNEFVAKNKSRNFTELSQCLTEHLKNAAPEISLICGYSLGGRVGLHLLREDPIFFSRLFMLSAHVGIPAKETKEIEARRKSDEDWAQRFFTEPFLQVTRDWNAQNIFQNSSEPFREESKYDRNILSNLLKNFSLAAQEDFRPWLKENPGKVTWFFGERDQKYKALGSDLKMEVPLLEIVEIPKAGHRVIFDQPEFIAQTIKKVIS